MGAHRVPVWVAAQLSVLESYLPPVLTTLKPSVPPQIIISLSVHTPVCPARADGALAVLVGVQLSVLGSYLPPVFSEPDPSTPPHTIISLPVQTAVCPARADG